MTPRRALPILLAVLAVATAACGVRVDPSLLHAAANAELGRGPSGAGGSGAGITAGSSGAATEGLAGSGGGTATPAADLGATGAAGDSPSATGPGGAGGTGGTGGGSGAPGAGGVGSAAPAGGNGGATDIGVTANSITLGNISDLSGPVPGLFQSGIVGTEAYLNYVNSQGGVFGRQLKLVTADSETDCAATQNAYNSMTPKVFGFVGSWELYDQCAAQALGSTNLPAAQYALSPQAAAWPGWFSVDPIKPGTYPNGPFGYFAKKFGSAIQHTGTIYGDLPSIVPQEQGMEAAAQSVGFKYVYKDAFPATQSNFTTDVVRMESSGVKVVLEYTLSTQQAATLVQEINQQNWHPIIICGVCYANNFEQLVGGGASAVQGIIGSNFEQLFFNKPASVPEVGLYQQWMQRTNPSQNLDLESFYSWTEAALFVQALKAAGPKVTRAGVVTALKGIKSFGDNGAFGPSNIGDKVPTNCYVLWQVTSSGAFQEFDTPAGGFNCNGQVE